MNKFYLSVALILCFNFAFSAPVIKSVKNGYWDQASSWDLNRIPKAGDTIVLAASYTITIDNDVKLDKASFIKVLGRLVFQKNNSTLSMANGSFIWVYSGALIMGGGSPSQKLRMDNSIIFDGNDDPIYGPMMASASTNGFIAMNNAPSITLPVKFESFTVTKKNNDVLVQWSTSEEINANMYEVERSLDGSNWSTIAYVAATGNSSATNNYSYTDKNISAKIVYYRIKEVDVDGSETITSIKSIRTDLVLASSDIKIAAVQNKVLLQFPQQVNGNVVVRFVSTNGQVVDQQLISNPAGQVVINAKFTGNYFISITDGNQINTAKQVIL